MRSWRCNKENCSTSNTPRSSRKVRISLSRTKTKSRSHKSRKLSSLSNRTTSWSRSSSSNSNSNSSSSSFNNHSNNNKLMKIKMVKCKTRLLLSSSSLKSLRKTQMEISSSPPTLKMINWFRNNNNWTNLSTSTKSTKTKWSSSFRSPNSFSSYMFNSLSRSKKASRIRFKSRICNRYKISFLSTNIRFRVWRGPSSCMSIKSSRFSSCWPMDRATLILKCSSRWLKCKPNNKTSSNNLP